MPVVGKGFDLFQRIAAELFADHVQFIIQADGADGDIGGLLLHQVYQTHPCGLRIATLGQGLHCRLHQSAHVILRQCHVLQPDDLALTHRDAAVNLPKVFAKCDLVDQLFNLAKFAV